MVDIKSLLSNRLGKRELELIADWASNNEDNINLLFSIAYGDNGKIGSNALWCMTHLKKNCNGWLQSKQDSLIDLLLKEEKTARKRMLLQLLREQRYKVEDIRVDFLDFCMNNINSECEQYAIRCFSLYIAIKICRYYPELLDELKERISMLSRELLSPGMRCAVRKVNAQIQDL
ncbi:MAG: hypothetical protein K2N35_06560 [Muribaculaceae bacterium]|nr:hypothetical protein [Muribaculaceae bacterium]